MLGQPSAKIAEQANTQTEGAGWRVSNVGLADSLVWKVLRTVTTATLANTKTKEGQCHAAHVRPADFQTPKV